MVVIVPGTFTLCVVCYSDSGSGTSQKKSVSFETLRDPREEVQTPVGRCATEGGWSI